MLTNEDHLKQTQSALSCLERALASIRRDRAKMHPDWYRIMAGPVADQVRRLRAQIDEYTGLNDPAIAEEVSESHANEEINGALAGSEPVVQA